MSFSLPEVVSFLRGGPHPVIPDVNAMDVDGEEELPLSAHDMENIVAQSSLTLQRQPRDTGLFY